MKFTSKDISVAASFAERANLAVNEPPSITTTESEDDTMNVGFFTIQLVEDVREVTTILGTVNRSCVAFVVWVEMVAKSFVLGEVLDEVEVARESNLYGALRACALEERGWQLDAILESIGVHNEENEEVS